MKILYHGDSPSVATGFGNVSRMILKGLKELDPELDITVIGINERGGHKDPAEYPYKIYPAIYDDYHDIFGMKRLIAALEGADPEIPAEQYDVLFINYDYYLLTETRIGNTSLMDGLKQVGDGIPKKILYTPIDNHQMRPEWIESFKWFDEIIVPSYYGKRVIESYDKDLGRKVKVIYNPTDSQFRKLDQKVIDETKTALSQQISEIIQQPIDLSKKFILGFVGRNQWRKDLYRLVKIYSAFKKKHPEAYIYIHTNPLDMMHDGGNLMELFRYYGLAIYRDYLVPLALNDNEGITRSDLNEWYNIMNVYVSASMAEGFGMPYMEAMAAGTIPLAPNNTTVPELFNFDKVNFEPEKQVKSGRGLVYRSNNTVCFGEIDQMRERELGDIDDALEKLEYIYYNYDKLDVVRSKGIEFATAVTPEEVAKQFHNLIKNNDRRSTTKVRHTSK